MQCTIYIMWSVADHNHSLRSDLRASQLLVAAQSDSGKVPPVKSLVTKDPEIEPLPPESGILDLQPAGLRKVSREDCRAKCLILVDRFDQCGCSVQCARPGVHREVVLHALDVDPLQGFHRVGIIGKLGELEQFLEEMVVQPASGIQAPRIDGATVESFYRLLHRLQTDASGAKQGSVDIEENQHELQPATRVQTVLAASVRSSALCIVGSSDFFS